MLKVLSVSTYENAGGAARSAGRLHRGLLDVGVESSRLVQCKSSNDASVLTPRTAFRRIVNFVRPYLDSLPILLYRPRLDPPWCVSWLPKNITDTVSSFAPEIVHLHWINNGFLSITDVARINCPIIWTFHDSWSFTGGCSLPGNCDRYTKKCGYCPQLNSSLENDLSRWIWTRKSLHWQSLNITVVTPSKWLADAARASSLFRKARIEVIPNGIDIGLYRNIDKQTARKRLGLPLDRKLLLFGAANFARDLNKGAAILASALELLSGKGWVKKADLVLFGAEQCCALQQTGFAIHYLGKIDSEEELAHIYAAADLFILPSMQENLPNTALESMACGTPCVAFRIGGVPEIIDHTLNGYLAEPFSIEDLARGIAWIVADNKRYAELAGSAREKIKLHFDINSVVMRYLNLFSEVKLLFQK